MKYMMLILCAVTSFSMVANSAPAAKKKAAKSAAQVTKIFLTDRDLAFLNIEERVDYLVKLAEYMTTVERIQEKILKLEGKDKVKSAYLEQINNFMSLLPQANAQGGASCICGTYPGIMSSSTNSCSVVGQSQSCGAGKFTCNERIYSIPKSGGGLEPTCISNSSSCSSRSSACTEALKSKLNAMTDGARVKAWSERSSQGLTSLRMQALGAKRIGEHCASRPNDKDCQALTSIESELTARGAQVQSQEQKISEMAQDFQSRHNPTMDPFNSKGIGADPLIPADGEYPVPAGDCTSRNQAQLGALACVACGLEAADPAVAQGGGAEEFIALMGVVSQTYKGPHATNDSAGRQKLQEDVINRLANYGYCTDLEYTGGAGMSALSSGSASQIRGIIDGQQPMKRGWFLFKRVDNNALTPVMSSFGIEAKTKWGASAYSHDMFSERGGSAGYAQNQQTSFAAISRGYYKGYPNSRFSRCAKAIENRRHQRMESRVCKPRSNSTQDWQFNQENMNANDRMVSSIRSACGLPPKQPSRWGNRACTPNCHNTTGFFASWFNGCRDGDGPGVGGPGGPGKGGEDSSGRDTGKGAEGGDGGRDSGKGAEGGGGNDGGKGAEGNGQGGVR